MLAVMWFLSGAMSSAGAVDLTACGIGVNYGVINNFRRLFKRGAHFQPAGWHPQPLL
jgi:hypothetical protein